MQLTYHQSMKSMGFSNLRPCILLKEKETEKSLLKKWLQEESYAKQEVQTDGLAKTRQHPAYLISQTNAAY